MGKDIFITYPTIDRLAARVAELGMGCALFKRDLTSTFRQLYADPFDYSLMIHHWQGKYYVDFAVAMGLVSAPSCCQRVTNALTAIHLRVSG